MLNRPLTLQHPREGFLTRHHLYGHSEYAPCKRILKQTKVEGVYARNTWDGIWNGEGLGKWYEIRFNCGCSIGHTNLEPFSYIEFIRYLNGKA